MTAKYCLVLEFIHLWQQDWKHLISEMKRLWISPFVHIVWVCKRPIHVAHVQHTARESQHQVLSHYWKCFPWFWLGVGGAWVQHSWGWTRNTLSLAVSPLDNYLLCSHVGPGRLAYLDRQVKDNWISCLTDLHFPVELQQGHVGKG